MYFFQKMRLCNCEIIYEAKTKPANQTADQKLTLQLIHGKEGKGANRAPQTGYFQVKVNNSHKNVLIKTKFL